MTQQYFSEVFNATITDVVSHKKTKGKPVKEISFAIERVIDPETNEVTMLNRSSFVREVYDHKKRELSELDLIALRNRRVQVWVGSDYWIIEAMDEN